MPAPCINLICTASGGGGIADALCVDRRVKAARDTGSCGNGLSPGYRFQGFMLACELNDDPRKRPP